EADQRVVLLTVATATGVLLLVASLDRPGDGATLAQAVLADDAHRHVDVARPRQVAGGPDEAVVVQQVEHTGHGHQHVVLGVGALLLLEGLAVGTAAAALAAELGRASCRAVARRLR